MSIVKQILTGAAAASIATGANAAEQKPLPPFAKPQPQEAVLYEPAFNEALKALITTLDAKVKPSDKVQQDVIKAAYNSIRQQQKKAPDKDQKVMLFDYKLSAAVVIDSATKTIAIFRGTEDAMSGQVAISDKKPILAYSADPAVKEETFVAEAIAALDKNNALMASRTSPMPNLGTALQPGGQGKLEPIKTPQR